MGAGVGTGGGAVICVADELSTLDGWVDGGIVVDSARNLAQISAPLALRRAGLVSTGSLPLRYAVAGGALLRSVFLFI